MFTRVSNFWRTLFVLLLILPFFAFAQNEIDAPISAQPEFLQNIKSEADFNNLSSEQQEQAKQYFNQISAKTTKIADVNLQNATIVNRDKGVFNLSFELANGDGVQTDVKYSVSLIKETEQGQFVVDTKVYPEVLTLAENSTVKKNITYEAPDGLNGNYKILIESKTGSGLSLGLGLAGEVVLAPDSKGLEIVTDTCFLQVAGEEGSPTYTLSQGVDIKGEENLLLTCDVTNYSPIPATVTPVFNTYFRTVYGEVVPHEGGSVEATQFAGNESKKITFTLPKALSPQSYDVRVSLKSESLETNSVIVHYVLVGSSATIQNVLLDKTDYEIGDTANLSFVWSPSADGFSGSRHGEVSPTATTLDISMTNGDVDCIAPQTVTLDTNSIKQELSIPVVADCFLPQLFLSLKDVEGNVLDETRLSPNGVPGIILPIESGSSNNSSNKVILVLIASIVFILLLIYSFFKHQQKTSNSAINSLVLLVVVSGLFLGGVERVEAVTWGFDGHWISVSSVNKPTYLPGENISVLSKTDNLFCWNSNGDYSLGGRLESCDANASPACWWSVMANAAPYSQIVNQQSVGGGSFHNSVGNFTAQAVDGAYSVGLTGWTGNFSDLMFRVANPWNAGPAAFAYVSYAVTSAPICAANAGNACSTSNSCGDTSSGVYACDGVTCSAATTPERLGYGAICSSPANACGMTNTGTNNICTASGVSCSASTPPNSLCAPVITFNANPPLIGPGNSSNLQWTVSGATSCSASGGWSGDKAFSGSNNEPVSPLTTTTYNLTCLNSSGIGTAASATVTLPSGNISASSCTISAGQSTCDSSIAWSTANLLGSPAVLLGANLISSAASNPTNPYLVSVSHGSKTFVLKDIGSTVIDTATANIGCASGSVWTGNSCILLPVIDIKADPNTVRRNETATLNISILANYDLSCTLYGAATPSFNHNASSVTKNYTYSTNPLTSAQVVRIECTAPTFPVVNGSAETRVNLIPDVEEI